MVKGVENCHTPGVIALGIIEVWSKSESVADSGNIIKIIILRSNTVTDIRCEDVAIKIDIVMVKWNSGERGRALPYKRFPNVDCGGVVVWRN